MKSEGFVLACGRDAWVREAEEASRSMKTVFVSVFPVVQHRHANGEIVSVKLKRRRGAHAAECSGCETRFVYQKPQASRTVHAPSPLLPGVKGNFDPNESAQ